MINNLMAVLAALVFMSCTSKDSLKKTLEENPDILFNAIEKNAKGFFEVLQKASKQAQLDAREGQAAEEEKQLEEEFNNPKKAEIDESRPLFGAKDAKVTIVEYSDFECPYCSRGYAVMKQVLKKYPKDVRVLYKHLPLEFHAMAEPTSRWYEAIALQDGVKAEKFHDAIFENQDQLKKGKEKFLEATAKKVGADVAKAKKDLNADKVSAVLDADMAEAKKFGFSGTPGFLVNGVSVRGAYPLEHFEKIIDRHLGKGG